MPTPRNPRLNPLVVAVTYDGLSLFAFACATEIFGLKRPEVGPGWYRFATCSPTGRPIRGEYGIRMAVDGGLELLARAGTVVIPGWHDIEAPVPPALPDWTCAYIWSAVISVRRLPIRWPAG